MIVPQLTKVKVPVTPKLIETKPTNVADSDKAISFVFPSLEGFAKTAAHEFIGRSD